MSLAPCAASLNYFETNLTPRNSHLDVRIFAVHPAAMSTYSEHGLYFCLSHFRVLRPRQDIDQ